jgi:hypothetical protein
MFNKRSNVRGNVPPVSRIQGTYGGLEVQFHEFLTSATDGGEQIALRLGRFTPRTETKITIK